MKSSRPVLEPEEPPFSFAAGSFLDVRRPEPAGDQSPPILSKLGMSGVIIANVCLPLWCTLGQNFYLLFYSAYHLTVNLILIQ
jgi:hypothetical protein